MGAGKTVAIMHVILLTLRLQCRLFCFNRRCMMMVSVLMVMMVSQCDVVTSYRKVIMVMVVHIAVMVIMMVDNNTARITT